MFEEIFPQLTLLFGLTVVMVFFAKLIKQPPIIAYLIAGVLAGPIFLNLFNGKQEVFEVFSQLGVILLLFVIGLGLNFNYLKKIGKISLIAGVGQVVFTATLGILLLIALDFSLMTAAYLAVAITFSSTIIITKLLSDKKDTESLYGRCTIGLMLVQDVVAIILMVVLTSFRSGEVGLTALLSLLIFKGIMALGLIFLLAKYVLPFILDKIAKTSEFLFVFTLAWCFGIAYLISQIGFSLEIGAIVAGISLGSSVYQPEISSRIKPLRDFFLIIFFIVLGAGLGLNNLTHAVPTGLILSAFILIGNPLILYVLFRLMGFTRRNSFLAGVTAAQVSEFGFVLLLIGQELGHIGETELAVFTLVAVFTIFTSSYLITYAEKIFVWLKPALELFSKENRSQAEERPVIYDVWIVGYHRIGWKIAEVLKAKKISFAVIDFNPEVIMALKSKNVPAYFGDCSDVEFINELPLNKAKLIISTVPDSENQLALVNNIKSRSPKTTVIANLAEAKYRPLLYSAGADYVMTPHLLGGHWLAQLIKNSELGKLSFTELIKEQEAEIAAGLPINNL
ncbi:MAG: cation:proton antiporter [Candidatus Komeilibacteria bacterium]|nr:cation:proton antiporter [Candidatus Komeilibacteria bacterium]